MSWDGCSHNNLIPQVNWRHWGMHSSSQCMLGIHLKLIFNIQFESIPLIANYLIGTWGTSSGKLHVCCLLLDCAHTGEKNLPQTQHSVHELILRKYELSTLEIVSDTAAPSVLISHPKTSCGGTVICSISLVLPSSNWKILGMETASVGNFFELKPL